MSFKLFFIKVFVLSLKAVQEKYPLGLERPPMEQLPPVPSVQQTSPQQTLVITIWL